MESGSVNQRKKKKWMCGIAVFALVCIIFVWSGPIVFARDGLLTGMKVEDYGTQYDFGSTRRHDAEVTDIYLFYFGFEEPSVQKEEKNGEVFEGREVEVKKVLPFLYKWARQSHDPAYRVTIGGNKYYYTLVST